METLALEKLISQCYSIEVLDMEKVKNAYKVVTPEGLKCFKPSKYDLKQYRFIMDVLNWLLQKGYPCIPSIRRTINGEAYIGYEDRYGFLCDWVESREADFENPVELRLCVESLAKLHLASEGFVFEDKTNIRYLFGRWIERFKRRCDELLYFKALIVNKNKHDRTEFDQIYLSLFEKHYRQGVKAVMELERSPYCKVMDRHLAKSCFCHHDTANHNFLITAGLLTYIIDFDYCVYDTFLHDLASLLIRNLKYGNWSFQKLEYILEIYSGIMPLDAEERNVTGYFMEFPQDYWQIGLQYYIENKVWTEDVFIKKLGRISTDIQDRNEFLNELRGRWSLD